MRALLILFTFIALPLTAQDAAPRPTDTDISPRDWMERAGNMTVYYYGPDGEYDGREYYWPDGQRVTWQFPDGTCSEGVWSYEQERAAYCFLYPSGQACYRHMEREREVILFNEITGSWTYDSTVRAFVPGRFTCTAAGVS